ncbi:dihydroneopterin aldolase [Dawidia soli]|uniref:7,8-dihydroneopterin aldolase n=1 Tax=Dawidia soli TaxID=2782352 RepID=A0AAP2DAC3_9BACT|nr:dihydroneopterin aldolase [Dawidia soli]MBT1688199.1 dihydroneopterin aldolase [Dawidia soli]
MTGRVALEGLEFHAFHGVYPHERESGNWFEVDIVVDTDFSQAAAEDDLNGTVNYETLFRIIQEEMDKPSKLLETVVAKIADDVMDTWSAVSAVEVKLSKLNPPIGGKCRRSSVTVIRRRGE